MDDLNLSELFNSVAPKPQPLDPEVVNLATETLKKVLSSELDQINPTLVSVIVSIIRGN